VTAALKIRLCTMMFLEFFIWGGWFVTMGSFLASNLHATEAQSAQAYSTQSWGAIIAPLFVGLLADRHVNAERLLAMIHLVGAGLMYALFRADRFSDFYPCLLCYMILYMPTLALVNAIAFRQIDDPSKSFASIRVWGTVGWVVAGLIISYGLSWDSPASLREGMLRNTFFMCSLASLALGLYSFTLPRTPPVRKNGAGMQIRNSLGLDALVFLKDRNFLVFFLSSILICIPLAFYYQNTNQFLTEIQVAHATGKQTIGQMSEVLFMLMIPYFLRRFGIKGTLLIGMAAWACRYLLFAFGNAHELGFLLLIGIALHGMCYDFFFVSGQIYTDSKVGPQNKSAAQGLITLATYGVGMLIGFWTAGRIGGWYSTGSLHDWRSIWLYPAAFAALIFFLFLFAFDPPVARAGASNYE
jgi:nucleoside transporter